MTKGSRLGQALNAAERSKPFRDVLAKAAIDAFGPDTPAAFATDLETDSSRWGRVVKNSGFTPED